MFYQKGRDIHIFTEITEENVIKALKHLTKTREYLLPINIEFHFDKKGNKMLALLKHGQRVLEHEIKPGDIYIVRHSFKFERSMAAIRRRVRNIKRFGK